MYRVLYRFIYDKTSTSSPSSMDYHHKVTSSYDSGIGSGQSSYHPDGMSNFVSSFDKNSFTSEHENETLSFATVEDSPLDLCNENFDDHTSSQDSVAVCKRKCSSPCLGMKKLQIFSPTKFTQEFEQDGSCRYNA